MYAYVCMYVCIYGQRLQGYGGEVCVKTSLFVVVSAGSTNRISRLEGARLCMLCDAMRCVVCVCVCVCVCCILTYAV